jgi:hypothetical protein
MVVCVSFSFIVCESTVVCAVYQGNNSPNVKWYREKLQKGSFSAMIIPLSFLVWSEQFFVLTLVMLQLWSGCSYLFTCYDWIQKYVNCPNCSLLWHLWSYDMTGQPIFWPCYLSIQCYGDREHQTPALKAKWNLPIADIIHYYLDQSILLHRSTSESATSASHPMLKQGGALTDTACFCFLHHIFWSIARL